MRGSNVTCLALAVCLIGLAATRSEAQVTLTWAPSSSPSLTGYNVCYGTNSRIYLWTNFCPVPETNVTISTLTTYQVYYFAVQSVSSNGLTSAFCAEEDYTNSPPAGPPGLPNGSGSGTPTNGSTQVAGGTGGSSGSGTNTSVSQTSSGSGTVTQSTFWGVPPFLTMAVSNGQINLKVGATVGATLNVVASSNDLSMNSWSVVTNFAVSNVASIGETNQAQDILDVAFVPGTQSIPVASINSSAKYQYFLVVMPYDYAILADQVLLSKTNYTPRLILINMPGLVDDSCYVNEASSFIHYVHTNYALQLISSGSTIRQIASTLATTLNLDWTTASEFTYSNGLGQILATVIETESPSQDPVAGQNPPSSPIVIDF